MSASKLESQKIFEKLRAKPANKICFDCIHISFVRSTNLDQWQWQQLRIMKVGGNESATKYFRSHGGSAALASTDAKIKYTSNAAVKYKEELKRRAALDAEEYPDEVVITEELASATPEGASTPSGDGEDDFFSSWDKPAIKRPSNPPSRTATPPTGTRSSPFLNINSNGNGGARPKSPLSTPEQSTPSAPVAVKTSTAVRKGPSVGTKKGSILGAKKAPKLGVKKVSGRDAIDFEEVERKAKEEAERIAKLGYDPESERAEDEARSKSGASSAKIISPVTAGSGRLGTPGSATSNIDAGMSRLGLGQTGKPKVPAPKRLGFGAVGPANAAAEEEDLEAKSRKQKGISSDQYFGRKQIDPNVEAESRARIAKFEGVSGISSNAYFGRPEDDLQDDDYGDLETAARDFVRKFGITAGDDLENLSHLVGEGAVKLHGAIRNYLNS
ncbi:ADP-ribosylation factor GTPase activating protein, ER-Golgi transport [Myotisia sp. PD_48]|nr:ADP-ribosylation factor GTPase activating protein, ER-Golgi transport [Myotisia sp. PD_48]